MNAVKMVERDRATVRNVDVKSAARPRRGEQAVIASA
jgi:hypothetical protein